VPHQLRIAADLIPEWEVLDSTQSVYTVVGMFRHGELAEQVVLVRGRSVTDTSFIFSDPMQMIHRSLKRGRPHGARRPFLLPFAQLFSTPSWSLASLRRPRLEHPNARDAHEREAMAEGVKCMAHEEHGLAWLPRSPSSLASCKVIHWYKAG